MEGNGDRRIVMPSGGFITPGVTSTSSGKNFAKARADKKELNDRVVEDGDEALPIIHAALTQIVKKFLTKAARAADPPGRAEMDMLREFRQSQEAINEARKHRGAEAQASEFFATMSDRVHAAMASMPDGPQPVIDT